MSIVPLNKVDFTEQICEYYFLLWNILSTVEKYPESGAQDLHVVPTSEIQDFYIALAFQRCATWTSVTHTHTWSTSFPKKEVPACGAKTQQLYRQLNILASFLTYLTGTANCSSAENVLYTDWSPNQHLFDYFDQLANLVHRMEVATVVDKYRGPVVSVTKSLLPSVLKLRFYKEECSVSKEWQRIENCYR